MLYVGEGVEFNLRYCDDQMKHSIHVQAKIILSHLIEIN